MSQVPHRGYARRRGWLLALAVLCALPVMAVYWNLALSPLLRVLGTDVSGPASWVHFAAMVPYWAAARWVLRFPTPYLATSLISLILALAALLPLSRPWRRAIAPVVLMLLVAFFPLVYRYRPALSAAPGYREIVLSPTGFPDSVTRAARAALELRTCEYTLLGWFCGELYYQESCGTGVAHRAFDPIEDPAPHPVTDLPAEWDHSVLPKAELLAQVRASSVRPAVEEPEMRPALLAGDGLVSHDGRWTALIGGRPSGPQDVMVIEAVDH